MPSNYHSRSSRRRNDERDDRSSDRNRHAGDRGPSRVISRNLRSRKVSNSIREINASDSSRSRKKTTLLHEAVLRGNLNSVRALLQTGVSPDLKDSDWNTPLLLAVKNGKINLVKELIGAKANLNVKDSKGSSCLHYAVLNKNVEIVELLLSAKAYPKLVNCEGDTPLLCVFRHKKAVTFKQTLFDTFESCSCSTKHPVLKDVDLNIIQLLLKAGADVNSVAKDGDTPLLLAIRSERVEVVQQFIEAGANVNYVDFRSEYPRLRSTLHEAVHVCNVEILKLLLDHGANPNQANRLHYSVLSRAANASRNKIPILNLLLDHGANMYNGGTSTRQNMYDHLPFEGMLADNDVEGVRLFLERGFDLTRFQPRDNSHSTPLHDAVQILDDCWGILDDTSMLSLFIEYYETKGTISSELERTDDLRGWTPLFYTADGSDDHLELLLQAGANPNITDKLGRTPLEIAASGRERINYECMRLLIEYGAELGNLLDQLLEQASERNEANAFDENYIDEIYESDSPMDYSDHDSDKDDWFRLLAVDVHANRYTRGTSSSMKKAMFIVRCRVLHESLVSEEDPVHEKVNNSDTLQNYYEACKAEISFLQNCQFEDTATAYDMLTQENFWRRVKSSDAFEDFRNQVLPDSGGLLSENLHIYANDVKNCWKSEYDMYEFWTAALNGLEYLLGFDKNSYHLIYSNIMDRLDDDDWKNLGIVCDMFVDGDASSDISFHTN
ncbi:hypothetical protein QAD02_014684 [Eretmocerus hayati]|uniref:Uncharacterized protein n=1 Tax=Eretmocerus hayati TaxID=131215 RepID=A0ACC2P8V9_9HYME|nr:hypothetical protein QAD02_014684 [Eretmocerus hayati]